MKCMHPVQGSTSGCIGEMDGGNAASADAQPSLSRRLFSTRSRLLRSRQHFVPKRPMAFRRRDNGKTKLMPKYFGFFKIDWAKTISHEQYADRE